MVLFGFMVNYMLRVNFTIAIVDMVPVKQNNSAEPATNYSFTGVNDTNVSTSNVILLALQGINYTNTDCRFFYIISEVTNFVFILIYF